MGQDSCLCPAHLVPMSGEPSSAISCSGTVHAEKEKLLHHNLATPIYYKPNKQLEHKYHKLWRVGGDECAYGIAGKFGEY